LTYRELWPFAFQDNKDLGVISDVVREAKRIDPGGMSGAVCEVVHMILNGHARDAQGLADSALLEASSAPALFEIRGDLYTLSKDFQNAASYFERAHSIWPQWQKSAVQAGRAKVELKQHKDAIQLFRGVLAKVPDHAVAKVELGLVEALQFNQLDKGLDLINSGVDKKIPRTIASRGYFGIAQIHVKRQQKSRAVEAARKALELDPGNNEAKELVALLGGSSKVKHGETDLIFLGEQYLRSGDFFSAQAQFKAAFEANPKNGLAAMKAGKCLWQLSQTAEAIEWMRKALRADPRLIPAYVELADYYAQRFDYFEAVEVLKKAQAIQPNGFEVYRGFAVVELRRNNFNGALAFAQRALKLYETDIQTLLLMAKAHLGLQQYNDARKYAASALDIDYNEIEAHSLFAKIEAGLHGVDSAVTYIQQLLNRYVIIQGQQVPQAAIDLRVTLGEIHMQDERFKTAEETYRQAIALEANSS
jgi:tetratricopeptide (TPR) repeat protein